MKVHCSHSDRDFLTTQMRPIKSKSMPTTRVRFDFCLRQGGYSTLKERWGLVDTGAEVTVIPFFWLYETQVPMQLRDPSAVLLRGLYGQRQVPGYLAKVSINGCVLSGSRCPRCARTMEGGMCRRCRVGGPGLFLVAAVEGLYHPLVGMDILGAFRTTVDPWQKSTMLENGLLCRGVSRISRYFCGRSLTPP
jgi:hypothetical protein